MLLKGPIGTRIESLNISWRDDDETTFGRTILEPAFRGLDHPTATELNALDSFSGSFSLLILDTMRASFTGTSFAIFQIELAPVPLPAGADVAGRAWYVGLDVAQT